MNDDKTVRLCKTAVMAALVFLGTYFFKIPSPNGYTHLGDCMIFIAVLVLGGKDAALAGGIGAALADALGGYMIWVVPTFIIKALMAVIMFYICKKGDKGFGLITMALGASGGAFQVICYTLVKIPIFGMAYAMVRLPGLIVQTVCGIVISIAIAAVLNGSGIIKKIREV